MNILFTGKGRAGSWKIRGEQLGAAMKAKVLPNADARSISKADLVIVVKRCPDAVISELRRQHKLWAFDVLDFYPQPDCAYWSQKDAINWVKQKIAKLNPPAIIWPNHQMMKDCNDGRPSLVLYHHFRPALDLHEVKDREHLTIGYEGNAQYLGDWEPFLKRICADHRWKFVVNPVSISICDAVIAIRAQSFSGYAQFHWKSNVKLANAQGCGTPFIGQSECSYMETSSGGELFADCKSQMVQQLNRIQDKSFRAVMSQKQFAKRYSVSQAAQDLQGFINGL